MRFANLCWVVAISAVPVGCELTAEECRQANDRAATIVETARAANLTCTVVEDCVTVSVSTNCAGACPDVVNSAGVTAVEAAVDQANREECDETHSHSCGYASPGCALWQPACEQATCILVDPGL